MSSLARRLQKRMMIDRYGLRRGLKSWWDSNGDDWGPRLPNIVTQERREIFLLGGLNRENRDG